MIRSKTLVAALIIARVLAEPVAATAELTRPSSMTLARAIEDGARRGPPVIESSRTREAAASFARNPGSSLPMTPQVTVMAGGRKPYNLPLGPEVAVTAAQEVSMRGLGSARRRAAEWALRAATSDVERARIEGGLSAALSWIDLLEAQALLSARQSAADDAAKLGRLAEIRVASGTATATERSLASAEVGAAKLAVLEAEGRATEAGLTLALATGEPFERTIIADGSLDAADAPVHERDAIAGAARHPALQAAEARASHQSAEIAVARAIAGPFFSVGGTVWREGSGDLAAAAIVSVPLPLFNPARYDEARQAMFAEASAGHAGRLRAELEREVRAALHERTHTRAVRDELREGVVAPLRRALDTAVVSYAAGSADLSVVLLARRSALGAGERLVVASADVQRADVRVAALSGALLARRPR